MNAGAYNTALCAGYDRCRRCNWCWINAYRAVIRCSLHGLLSPAVSLRVQFDVQLQPARAVTYGLRRWITTRALRCIRMQPFSKSSCSRKNFTLISETVQEYRVARQTDTQTDTAKLSTHYHLCDVISARTVISGQWSHFADCWNLHCAALPQQEAQLSQMLRVIEYFANSLKVTQNHCKWHHSIDLVWVPFGVP